MSIEQVLAALRVNYDFMQQVVTWKRIAPRPARYGELPPVDGSIEKLLRQHELLPLYRHQSRAIDMALSGRHVVVATTTASGKTLCYNVPTLQRLRDNRHGRALYLFPTKALAQDQLAALKDLAGDELLPAVYDGDTARGHRSRIRRHARVILSNPDMLHAGVLPYHTNWRDFFANLELIVVDEIHSYRGVFGSHVANVLRRLRRICNFYGSRPQFICCSATIANPQAHAERLCNESFALVDERDNGAPQGEKHFILYNPPLIDAELGLRQSVILSAMEAAAYFLQNDVQTVAFARSRQSVEVLLGYLRDSLAPTAGDEDASSSADEKRLNRSPIAGYRGGYLPLERRQIEEGLRDGRLRGVVATNALELGVDIGRLDAAVMAGYPGTIASVWQQAGRAGRRDALSAALLIAGNSPLEQYICRHPRYLFGRSPESALINPDNLPIAIAHLQCAAYELPFEPHEDWGELGAARDLLDALVADGQLHRSGNRYHWIGDSAPATSISLRTSSADTVVIQRIDSERREVIGEVDLTNAPVTVYPDAVYLHRGEAFIVDDLDWDARLATVRAIDADYYTRATVSSDIQMLSPQTEKQGDGLLWAHGEVIVVAQATGYRKIRRYTHETLGLGKIDLPPSTLDTTGYWLVLGKDLTEQLYDAGILLRPNSYGPNWQTQRQKALRRDEHRCRTCNAEGLLHVHHIRPFREYGYRAQANDFYLKANRLENLITLCPSCHRRAEAGVQARSALGGLSYVLRNLAPLFLMCDAGDIQVSAESHNRLTSAPTLVIYETAAAGVGFDACLFEKHEKLLRAAVELVDDCPCNEGCPACVGPPAEIGPQTKQITRHLIDMLIAQSQPS